MDFKSLLNKRMASKTVLVALMAATVGLGFVSGQSAQAWDGHWTQAPSGTYPLPEPDPKAYNIDTNSGAETHPRYFVNIMPPRNYDDVDPAEMADYTGKNYSPYALTEFMQDLHWQGKTFPKGYYHVKISRWGVASNNTLPLMNELHAEARPQLTSVPEGGKDKAVPMDVLVLKQHGTVMTVIPIVGHEAYDKPKHSKWPADSLAWVEWEGDQPVLKFYYKKTVYFAYMDP